MRLPILNSHILPHVRALVGAFPKRPVVIFGNQKSGTSAIAHLLADYAGVSKAVDIPPLWPPASLEIRKGQKSMASVMRRHPRYFLQDVLKEPNMTFFMEEVFQAFPAGKFVFIVRDPRENIRSTLDRYGIEGTLDELDRKRIPPELPHQAYFDASVWDCAGENYVGVLAHRWCEAADNYERCKHRVQIELVRYEDFIADKVGTISRLSSALGLEKRGEIADRVDRQYQPKGKHGSWLGFFSDSNLAAIYRICAARMKHYGYGNAERE